ncbi:Hypothetical protein UVM_LOCUS326 [uncultured virus]|nr:Hypothetical protein UVM_LOCUS326 [uncultured virus]
MSLSENGLCALRNDDGGSSSRSSSSSNSDDVERSSVTSSHAEEAEDAVVKSLASMTLCATRAAEDRTGAVNGAYGTAEDDDASSIATETTSVSENPSAGHAGSVMDGAGGETSATSESAGADARSETSKDDDVFTVVPFQDDPRPHEDRSVYDHSLKHWLRRFVVQQGENVDRTHGSMGFGLPWSLEPRYEVSFRDRYITAVYGHGEQVCISETRTQPCFRLFGDMDLHAGRPEELQRACSIFVRTVADFFPSLRDSPQRDPCPPEDGGGVDPDTSEWYGCGTGFGRLRALVFSPPTPKPRPDPTDPLDAERVWELGAHVHWIGNLRVTTAQAKDIRRLAIARCEAVLGPRIGPGKNPWSNVFDLSVYKGSGLRMVGSFKRGKCKKCNGTGSVPKPADANDKTGGTTTIVPPKAKRRRKQQQSQEDARSSADEAPPVIEDQDPCPEKCFNGHVMVQRVYRPWMVLDGHGRYDPTMEWLCRNPHEFVHATTIRTLVSEPSPEYREAPGLPAEEETLEAAAAAARRRAAARSADGARPVAAPGGPCRTGERLDLQSEEARVILEAVRGTHPKYCNLIASKLFRSGERRYRLEVKGEGCSYCQNVDDKHSNYVYFVIVPQGIIQKCYSTKKCEGYESAATPITRYLRDLLFGSFVPRKVRVANPSAAVVRTAALDDRPHEKAWYDLAATLERHLLLRSQEFFPEFHHAENIERAVPQRRGGKARGAEGRGGDAYNPSAAASIAAAAPAENRRGRGRGGRGGRGRRGGGGGGSRGASGAAATSFGDSGGRQAPAAMVWESNV